MLAAVLGRSDDKLTAMASGRSVSLKCYACYEQAVAPKLAATVEITAVAAAVGLA